MFGFSIITNGHSASVQLKKYSLSHRLPKGNAREKEKLSREKEKKEKFVKKWADIHAKIVKKPELAIAVDPGALRIATVATRDIDGKVIPVGSLSAREYKHAYKFRKNARETAPSAWKNGMPTKKLGTVAGMELLLK